MSSERQLDNTNNPWWGEHLHRYEEAAKLIHVPNAKIIDIACGSGFGSHYLAQLGYRVIGGDLSQDTVLDCARKYKTDNLEFKQIDGTQMPFENEFFDVVISFETIEHTTEFQKMLNEFKRVVKKDGIIIISTPNFLINSPGGVIINKYHTQEWIYEDLLKLLKSSFSEVNLMGQEYVRYKNQTSFTFKVGKFFEETLYKRGFRKLPLYLQDVIIKTFIGQPMYPLSSNYAFTKNVNEIKDCKTFFVICKV